MKKKRVFVYGDKVINETLPGANEREAMLTLIGDHLIAKKEDGTREQSERPPRRPQTRTKKEAIKKKKSLLSKGPFQIFTKRARIKRKKERQHPRHAFRAQVLIQKNQRFQKGPALNISKSGIFVETAAKLFEVGEAVRLIIKTSSGDRYKVVARIARYNDAAHAARGYGLEFVKANV